MVRQLQLADHHPARLFGTKLDFEDIKFPVKVRDIHKIEKKNCINISISGYEKKGKISNVSKKCCEEKHVDLLFLGDVGKKYYVPVRFKYIHV